MTLDKLLEWDSAPEGAALARVSFSLESGEWGAVADREYRHRPVVFPGGTGGAPVRERRCCSSGPGRGSCAPGSPGKAGAWPRGRWRSLPGAALSVWGRTEVFP